ncbi:hypothetical protein [Winogradskyella ursingii]|uniref:hypothetical protein n=1 Tax=Winogradskyella ursingii TaxID=2686079 RepID=UPI0015C80017|nr:hypothetical protein [Winogradskyella ursingii]
MANFHVGNITSAVRNIDGNQYNEDHYKKFGWKGLSAIGLASNPQIVTTEELTNYNTLANIPLNDNHNLICDE